MRVARFVFPVVSALFLCFSLSAQQTAQTSPQALALLQSSLTALTNGQALSDVTLSGTARRIAGSDDESGTATLKALSSGPARLDLSFSSGPRAELFNPSATPPAGSWSGPDGISHAMPFHNLLTEPAWFFPAFAISRRLSSPGFVAKYVGLESLDGRSVHHISISQTSSPILASTDPLFPHLTQVDFFLDSSTLLPAAISFNVHPDNNELFDLPVLITFSNYQTVGSCQIPFHIQKFLNNSLLLDFQAQSATPNSGLSGSIFNAL